MYMQKRMYKVVIIGDGGVGKTTLLVRYIEGKFLANTQMTIGTNFFIKRLKIPEINSYVTLQIWDIGNQDQFALIRQNFYQGANGVIYTFDLTRNITYFNLLKWKKEIDYTIGETPSVLVGTKLDITNEENVKYYSRDINEILAKLKSSVYLETSSKNNVGVDDVFEKLALEIYNSIENANNQ